MWLINTTSLALEDIDPDDDPYAILSHTWGRNEVGFRDITNLQQARTKPSFSVRRATR
jgi:hypothetical protein